MVRNVIVQTRPGCASQVEQIQKRVILENCEAQIYGFLCQWERQWISLVIKAGGRQVKPKVSP